MARVRETPDSRRMPRAAEHLEGGRDARLRLGDLNVQRAIAVRRHEPPGDRSSRGLRWCLADLRDWLAPVLPTQPHVTAPRKRGTRLWRGQVDRPARRGTRFPATRTPVVHSHLRGRERRSDGSGVGGGGHASADFGVRDQPRLRTSLIFVPAGSLVPAAGRWRTTRPARTLFDVALLTVPTRQWAAAIFFLALASVFPTT